MSDPVVYTSNNAKQRRDAINLLNEYAEEVKNISGKCMDVGCGPGDITKDILLSAVDKNATIIGTDLSENMIKYAKMTHRNEKRLKFDVMDIQTKNLPKKYISQFDHIFSFYALHWCKDIRQAFENIYRMLRFKGTILFNMICDHNIYEITELLSKDVRYSPYIQEMGVFISPLKYSSNPQEELTKLLNSVGFHVQHCSLRKLVYPYDNLDESISMLMSILMFLRNMPQELRQEFRNDFSREYIKRSKWTNGNPKEIGVLDEYTLLVTYGYKLT